MYIIKFCRAPSHKWVGMCEYNGGHVFSSGSTMDELVKHMKGMMYLTGKVSARQLVLDSKQHTTDDFANKYSCFMSPMFFGKFWKDKSGKEKEPETHPVVNAVVAPLKAPSAYEHITEIKDNELVVYKLVEVARYKLRSTKTNEECRNSDSEIPVCPVETKSQGENL